VNVAGKPGSEPESNTRSNLRKSSRPTRICGRSRAACCVPLILHCEPRSSVRLPARALGQASRAAPLRSSSYATGLDQACRSANPVMNYCARHEPGNFMPRSHGNSGNLYLKLTVSRGDPDAQVSTSATTRNAGTLELALCNVATPILSDRVPEGEVEVYVYSIKSFPISACPRCNLTSDTRSGTPGGRAGTTASHSWPGSPGRRGVGTGPCWGHHLA